MRTTLIFALLSMFALFFTPGCVEETQTEVFEMSEAQLQGGCRWDCPKCVPNKPCSRRACYLVCPPGKTPCGDNVCGKGEVCVDALQGICANEGSVECTTDADCSTFSNYCDGCNCEALSSSSAAPICGGTVVNCFADPCMNQSAVCNAGVCELASTL